MRKWFVMSLIGGLALLPAVAFADVDLHVDIWKSKDKQVSEELDITKNVDIDVEVELRTQKAAESEALVNQQNENNREFNFSNTSISVGIVGGSGIVGVNQASGNMNNQANAVSVAVDPSDNNDDPFDPGSFGHSQAASDQKNEDNKVVNFKPVSAALLGVSGNGIVSANQASGSMNNQANAVSVAVGAGPLGVAISEADLGQVNTNNVTLLFNSTSIAVLSTSGSGIINANQSSGHMNNQSNVVSFAAVN